MFSPAILNDSLKVNFFAFDLFELRVAINIAQVTERLVKILNLETDEFYKLNDELDICLNQAKNLGMRGNLIDAAMTVKLLRDNVKWEAAVSCRIWNFT